MTPTQMHKRLTELEHIIWMKDKELAELRKEQMQLASDLSDFYSDPITQDISL